MNPDSPKNLFGSLQVELRQLRGGVVDTSTLIYLERLRLLDQAAQTFRLVVIPQVLREFGMQPLAALITIEAQAGPADMVVCQIATALNLPVLTEDKGIIRAARQAGLPYYNAMMVLLALHAQGCLDPTGCRSAIDQLVGFARYSRQVIAMGEAIWTALRAEHEPN